MIAAIQDVQNLSSGNLLPVTNRSAELAAWLRTPPPTSSVIVELGAESSPPLTYNAAGRLESQVQVPGLTGNTPDTISLLVAENTRAVIANLFAPPPALPADNILVPVDPNTSVGGLPALTAATLLADIAANTDSFAPSASPLPAPPGFTTPETPPALAPGPTAVAPNATSAANPSESRAPPQGDDDAIGTPVRAAEPTSVEEGAEAGASSTDTVPATREAPEVATAAPELASIRSNTTDDFGSTDDALAPATPAVQPPAPAAAPELPELPPLANPVTPILPNTAGVTPAQEMTPVTTPILPTAMNTPIAAQNEIARNPFYPAMAASLYLSAMTDRFQQANGGDLDSPVDSVQPVGAVRPVAAASFGQESPSDDPRSGVPG